MSLPFATPEFAGIGGAIKQHDEDFHVQELPLYEPSGEGEHVFCEVQKTGLSTFEMIDRIARGLDVHPRGIGYGGMKDTRAVTRQVISILGTTEAAVMGLKIPGVEVKWAIRHLNKMRLGHHAGNRFAIKIRDVDPIAVTKLGPVLKQIETRGLPNFFGEQRFGRRDNNDLLGAALIRSDNRELAHLLLGDPRKGFDEGMQYKARRLYDEGDLQGSFKAWPKSCGLERRLLHQVIKTGKASGAGRVLEEKLRRLFVAALQSRVFNEVLGKRMDSYDKLIEGDWAYKHENGACFHVEDVAAEQARCAGWEISPTGPLIGFRVSLADKAAGEIEQAVLSGHKLTPEMFKVPGHYRVKGARRPLRVRPTELEYSAGVDDNGEYVMLGFVLPPGAFATVLLREVMKNEVEPARPVTGDEASGESEEGTEHPLGAVERDEED